MADQHHRGGHEVVKGGSGERAAPLQAVPPEIKQFIENQRIELEVRAREAEIESKRVDNDKRKNELAHEYAMKAIDVQAQDRREMRTSSTSNLRSSLLYITLGTMAALLLVGYALYRDKDALLIEIVRAILFFSGGGGLGYAVGKKRTKAEKDAVEESE